MTYSKELSESPNTNDYIQEAHIYDFFRHNLVDPVVSNYVLKSYTSGECSDGIFTIHGEDFNFLEIKSINDDLVNFVDDTVVGYVYILTEPINNIVDFKDHKPTTKPKLSSFIKSTLNTLTHLNMLYKFCHWDFHSENTRFNSDTGQTVIFDFDLSTVNKYTSSDYMNRIPFIRTLIKYHCKKYEGKITPTLFQHYKNSLAHNWDLYQFLFSLENKYSLDYLEQLNINLDSLDYPDLINTFSVASNCITIIYSLLTGPNAVLLPKLFKTIDESLRKRYQSITLNHAYSLGLKIKKTSDGNFIVLSIKNTNSKLKANDIIIAINSNDGDGPVVSQDISLEQAMSEIDSNLLIEIFVDIPIKKKELIKALSDKVDRQLRIKLGSLKGNDKKIYQKYPYCVETFFNIFNTYMVEQFIISGGVVEPKLYDFLFFGSYTMFQEGDYYK